MQAIRAAQKSDPDLLMDEEDSASGEVAVESTVTTISSRPPMESQVIAKSDRPDADDDDANANANANDAAFAESLGSLRVNLTPFVGPSNAASSSTDIRINTPMLPPPPRALPESPPVVIQTADLGEMFTPASSSRSSRVLPILFAILAIVAIAAVFIALRS